MKKKLFFLSLMVMMVLMAAAQVRLPGTHVSFQFPQGGWKYQNTINIDDNTLVYLYVYSGSLVTDSTGDTIVPFLRIFQKKNCQEDIYTMAYSRYTQQPFQSLAEYTEGVPQPGLGYVGAYSSTKEAKDYQFRMIYFKDQDILLEFRAQTTRDTYAQFDNIFDEILKSIKVAKK